MAVKRIAGQVFLVLTTLADDPRQAIASEGGAELSTALGHYRKSYV